MQLLKDAWVNVRRHDSRSDKFTYIYIEWNDNDHHLGQTLGV